MISAEERTVIFYLLRNEDRLKDFISRFHLQIKQMMGYSYAHSSIYFEDIQNERYRLYFQTNWDKTKAPILTLYSSLVDHKYLKTLLVDNNSMSLIQFNAVKSIINHIDSLHLIICNLHLKELITLCSNYQLSPIDYEIYEL